MARLRPALKTLILNSPAGPVRQPVHGLRAAYASIAEDADSRGLDKSIWISMLTAATIGLNSPGSLVELYHASSSTTHRTRPATDLSPGLPPHVANSLETAVQIRETGLKSVTFVGVPSVINHLVAFNADLPPDIQALLNPPPSTHSTKPKPAMMGPYPTHPFSRRILTPSTVSPTTDDGVRLFRSVYHPLDSKLVAKLTAAHPDLATHIIQSHYGSVLSVPRGTVSHHMNGTGDGDGDAAAVADVVGRATASIGHIATRVAAVACLRTQRGAGPQLLSHVFGLRKGVDEIVNEKNLVDGSNCPGRLSDRTEPLRWLGSDDGIEWLINSVDRFASVLNGKPAAKL